MPENIWEIKRKAPKKHFAALAEYDPLLVQILYNRGLKTQKAIDEFFNPDFDLDLHDPYLFTDMKRAVRRIIQAIENHERVGIYGDYDADGVTSSVVLTELLKTLGLKGQVYIPDRKKEGYGLKKKAIDYLKRKKITLIITCDCGVSNKKEIDYAKENHGIDVVVLDHHHVPFAYTKDYIVVDAKREGDLYPEKELSAVGVTFKLAEAFFRHEKKYLKVKNKEAFIKWLLDLVAIGTVADCVPLLSENRTLVTYGLKVISKTNRLGLMEMFKHAAIKPPINSFHLGYLIGPRINAAGRIDHANIGYKLLISQNRREAYLYAEKIEKTNKRRQKLSSSIYQEAVLEIEKEKELKKIIVIGKKDWAQGVLGIVAGKLAEKYSRPVIVLNIDKECVGSGRGPATFNLIKAIDSCKDLLLEYGGHQQAAGLTVKKENLALFKSKIEAIATKKLIEKDVTKKIEIDAKIKIAEIDWELESNLEKLSPFGEANPEPVFVISDAKLVSTRLVGNGKDHLKITVQDKKGNKIDGILFNASKEAKKIAPGDSVDLVSRITLNVWNGKRSLELSVIDFLKK